MGFWGNIGNAFAGSLSLGQWHPFGGDKKEDPIAALMRQIQPLIDQQLTQQKTSFTSGQADISTAKQGLQFSEDYWKNILNGSPDELLKTLDASSITKGIDENAQQLGELGVRGGARAAALGSAGFNRDAALNRVLEGLRSTAPDKLASIASAFGNLGIAQENVGIGVGGQASQNIFGITNAQLTQQQIHDEMIANIIAGIAGAAGGIAGGLCLCGETLVELFNGTNMFLIDIKVGDNVNSKGISRKVVRKEPSFCEDVVVARGLTGSKSHIILNEDDSEISLGELAEATAPSQHVYIIKLQDEEANYPFKTNGVWSLDADCKVGE